MAPQQDSDAEGRGTTENWQKYSLQLLFASAHSSGRSSRAPGMPWSPPRVWKAGTLCVLSPSGHLGLTHLPLSFLGLAVASCPVFMFWSLHLCVHCPPLNSAFKNALRVRVLLPHTPMQALRFLDTSSPTVAEARDCSRFVFVYVSLWHES